MNALHDADDVARDERRTHADPEHDTHRRLRDSRFNMFRWPVFLVAWAVGGAAILLALIYMAAT
ncbi:hypothetical protein [Azospira restricta]|uniref:Uncharacterized protein n=1 Tax=Azospira restricta TaxID=404405 RepID=A0A974SPN3_9RHOO|nr:hypothetical protein [Azospira restricta]QRJ64152.1 hypothetical protein IWH25_01995 [Azospira restricta]